MYVIGLTGNIATGKSTVATMLATLGACVIDADQVAHEVMRAGSEINSRIVARFGPRVRRPDGEIDRPWLASVVFSDPTALHDLEEIVHPAVITEIKRRLAECCRPICVIEAIKLLESGLDRLCNAIWVVICRQEQQLARLMDTRRLDRCQALKRIKAQPDPTLKLARADIIIDNSGSLDNTYAQVLSAWRAIPATHRGANNRSSAACQTKPNS